MGMHLSLVDSILRISCNQNTSLDTGKRLSWILLIIYLLNYNLITLTEMVGWFPDFEGRASTVTIFRLLSLEKTGAIRDPPLSLLFKIPAKLFMAVGLQQELIQLDQCIHFLLRTFFKNMSLPIEHSAPKMGVSSETYLRRILSKQVKPEFHCRNKLVWRKR